MSICNCCFLALYALFQVMFCKCTFLLSVSFHTWSALGYPTLWQVICLIWVLQNVGRINSGYCSIMVNQYIVSALWLQKLFSNSQSSRNTMLKVLGLSLLVCWHFLLSISNSLSSIHRLSRLSMLTTIIQAAVPKTTPDAGLPVTCTKETGNE